MLEDWSLWLADRGLSPKTRRNALGAFHSFLSWLRRRGDIRDVPEFPWPKVEEHEPRVLTIEDQDAILDAIPEPERGIFLALALLGLRPSEARALEVADYQNGWITVDKAVKGSSATAVIGGTKTGRGKRLPLPEILIEWITRHVVPAGRLRRSPLFINPRTGQRWSHWALRDRWLSAAKAVGIEGVRLYEGTKHTMATEAVRRGGPRARSPGLSGAPRRALHAPLRAHGGRGADQRAAASAPDTGERRFAPHLSHGLRAVS
jgi:integrase